MRLITVISDCPEYTHWLGKELGAFLLPGDCVPLTGELGSGKTCFVKGIAEGLGVSPSVIVNSPSFTIINQYPGRMPLYHVDLYRIGADGDLEDLEIMELIRGEGVTMIEWPQILLPMIGKVPLSIEFTWDMKMESMRSVAFTSQEERFDRYFDLIL